MSLRHKKVLITGASSGIGKATAEQLAAEGAEIILTGRRISLLENLKQDIKQKYDIDCLVYELDVRSRDNIQAMVDSLPAAWRTIDILVNNAGLALTSDKTQDGNPANWDIMIDTNIKGLLYMTHALLPGMLAQKSGHIINIGSIAGHDYYMRGNVYCMTKHAVKAFTNCLRIDLLGSPIRVTEISPGAVETEFSQVRWQDAKKAAEFYQEFTPLQADDIASSIVYCATRAPHINIAEMIVMPVDQASINYLNRPNSSTDHSVFKK